MGKRKERVELSFPGPQPDVITVIRHPPYLYLFKIDSIKGFLLMLVELFLLEAKLKLSSLLVVGIPPNFSFHIIT